MTVADTPLGRGGSPARVCQESALETHSLYPRDSSASHSRIPEQKDEAGEYTGLMNRAGQLRMPVGDRAVLGLQDRGALIFFFLSTWLVGSLMLSLCLWVTQGSTSL